MSIWSWICRTMKPLSDLAFAPIQKRSPLVDAIHLFVCINFAVAQPIYELLGRRTAFLLSEGIGLKSLFLLALFFSFLLPALLGLVERTLRQLSQESEDCFHALIFFVSLFLLALPIVNRVTYFPALAAIGAALTISLISTFCYLRFQQLRLTVTCAAPGIVLFPVMFLCYSPVSTVNGDPSSTRTNRFNPVPVVVLVCDEFCGSSLMTPERTIDANRFPNFAALAQTGTWFRNATSVNQMTTQAVPAILSGQYPFKDYNPCPVDLPQNLFSVLHLTGGYQLAAFEPVSVLAPLNLDREQAVSGNPWRQTCVLIDAVWRVYLFHIAPPALQNRLPLVPRAWFGLNDRHEVNRHQHRGVMRYGWGYKRDDQFQHFLETLNGAPEPTLYFMHALLPHMPWCFFPSGQRYAEDGNDWHMLESRTKGIDSGQWGPDELEVIHAQQRYLLQIMYVDQLLGKLIARLKQTGQYDRCLLIVTADHGISFRPGLPRRHLVSENQDEILAIPLFVKRPGQTQGEVSDRAVQSVDILPTIADVVGINLRIPTDGRSMFDLSHPDRVMKEFGDKQHLDQADPAIILNSRTPADIRKRFGDSSDSGSLFRIGPIPDMIGRSLKSLDLTGTDKVELEFSRYGDNVDSTAGSELPCLFEGAVRMPQQFAQPTVLAVAINGTIQAVTRTYLVDGFQDQWSALVPESALRAGKNDVQFFSVKGTKPNWRLSPCVTVGRK